MKDFEKQNFCHMVCNIFAHFSISGAVILQCERNDNGLLTWKLQKI